MPAALLVAVNVVHEITAGAFGDTAIGKRPVAGPVEVSAAGLRGDVQLTGGHGGPDRAVYAYAEEDAAWWAGELGREIPPGLFGENLRTRGLDVTAASIGELWRIGEVLLEVRMPRSPCANLSNRMGMERFHRRFHATGRVGAMLRVRDSGHARRLLGSGVSPAPGIRARARRILARTPVTSLQ